MPTAPKLIAAVFFACVAALAAHLFIPVLPEGTQIKMFRELSAGIGFFCGWFIMGRTVGRGMVEAQRGDTITCNPGAGVVIDPRQTSMGDRTFERGILTFTPVTGLSCRQPSATA